MKADSMVKVQLPYEEQFLLLRLGNSTYHKHYHLIEEFGQVKKDKSQHHFDAYKTNATKI